MQAIVDEYGVNAGLMALKAGVDVVLMPHNPIETIQKITEYIDDNQQHSDKIEKSYNRIYKLKQ